MTMQTDPDKARLIDLAEGDLVEIVAGGLAGRIGRVSITPGWETVGVDAGCVHIRKAPSELRLLKRARAVQP